MNDQPLVESIAGGDAVVFVGAGASKPSELPLWRDFLQGLLGHAESFLSPPDNRRAKEFLNAGDHLLAAEVLQRGLPAKTFDAYIKTVFKKGKPNDIHKSIARLPFSVAITTNFDKLLEAAYPEGTPLFSWRLQDAIFNSIRLKETFILKLHGDIDDPGSLRLTRSDYRDSTYATKNLELNECLKTLLTWKTFLFVGYSLRDSDFLRLMDEARMHFGNKFGPHYAIVPTSEVAGTFSNYLKDALSIECIEYEVDNNNNHLKPVVEILRNLAGRVAKLSQHTEGPRLDDFSITRAQAAQIVLNDSVRLTGSIRGDVCMIEGDFKPELSRVAVQPKPDRELPALIPDSVIHTAFMQAVTLNGREDFIYIKDKRNAPLELKTAGYVNAEYKSCDESVRSEVAFPILADGRRVGVLNLESDLPEAYTPDHIEVIGKVAQRLGQIYLRSEWRRRASAPLGGYYQRPAEFAELIKNSRLVRAMNHDFLLYEIDYENRRLVAHRAGDAPGFYWSFEEKSLARQVFEERQNILIPNAQLELGTAPRKTQLNEKGVDKFGISGPVFACPVRAGGQTEAVLVTWLKDFEHPQKSENRPKQNRVQWFRSSSGQISRLANLLANDIYESGSSRAKDFLEGFYTSLQKIDNGEIWTSGKLRDSAFRDQIMGALMSGLLHRACGFHCVRIWVTTRTEDLTHEDSATLPKQGFKIIDSLSTLNGTIPGKKNRKEYLGLETGENDAYCRYTIARFSHDPYAKWQHPDMFAQEDSNAAKLDKDPRGSWIVAPVVRPKSSGTSYELLGFISADSHERSTGYPKDCPESDTRVITLQCRIMDLIAELARHLIVTDVPRSVARGAS